MPSVCCNLDDLGWILERPEGETPNLTTCLDPILERIFWALANHEVQLPWKNSSLHFERKHHHVPGFRCDNAVEMQHYLQSFWQVGETQNYFVDTQKSWCFLGEKKKEAGIRIPKCQFPPSKCQRNQQNPPNFSLSAAFDHLAVHLIGSRRWHIRLVISETITTGTEAHMLRFGDPGDMVTWWLSSEGVTWGEGKSGERWS